MAYERPELFPLSFAIHVIRYVEDDTGNERKAAGIFETLGYDEVSGGDGNGRTRGDVGETSSSCGAYEADE